MYQDKVSGDFKKQCLIFLVYGHSELLKSEVI
uniref:Uncharacterized protein n=1 Tax=Anguilla anguilla TaxID=7936 RepID=A0A0E9TC11_ANGAN